MKERNYSPWLVRDTSLYSSKGVLVYLNEDQQTKQNKKSVFIPTRDDQYEYQLQSFKSIKVPMIRFHWYILKNNKFELGDFLTISDFVDQKRFQKEEKKAAALKISGQLSLEIETEKMFQIKNCNHKYDLVTAADFQTCYKCRMRRCVKGKCETDLSFVKTISEVIEHFDTTIQNVQHILALDNMLNLRLYCAGPKKTVKVDNYQVVSFEGWFG